MDMQRRVRREGGRNLAVLMWRFDAPRRMIASAPHGGGLGLRRWVVNAQVPSSYGRRDPDQHLKKLGVSLGLPGKGVGMLTAAEVDAVQSAADDEVSVAATVGLGKPTWAAAPDDGADTMVGTINIVISMPERLADAALVNAVATATEAKVQALADLGIEGTGTATDAICIVCPDDGRPSLFGGPRSRWGAPMARAVYQAITAGTQAWTAGR